MKLSCSGVFIGLTILVCTGCFGDSGGGGYSFTDQDAQGEIAGTVWTYVSGLAEESLSDNTKVSIDLYGIDPAGGDPCGLLAFTGANEVILFSVPAQVGVYEISSSQTATIYDGSSNKIVTSGGAIEITSIDTMTNNEVTGKVDLDFDGNNYVNGNFTVDYCP